MIVGFWLRELVPFSFNIVFPFQLPSLPRIHTMYRLLDMKLSQSLFVIEITIVG